MLTQVEQIIEQEKLDAIAAKVAETTTEVTKNVSENIARKMLKSGSTPEYVATVTEMTLHEVMELQKKL